MKGLPFCSLLSLDLNKLEWSWMQKNLAMQKVPEANEMVACYNTDSCRCNVSGSVKALAVRKYFSLKISSWTER